MTLVITQACDVFIKNPIQLQKKYDKNYKKE
jgi:hypothetical protein